MSHPAHCPTCDSPDPKLHPAMQWEGEVQPCDDMWHRIGVRIQELRQKQRRTKAEEGELAILTYDGPTPRRLPETDEVPF